MKKFAVSVILTKDSHMGGIDTHASLGLQTASSKEEAVGRMVVNVMEEHPGYAVALTQALEIDPDWVNHDQAIEGNLPQEDV